ncbi:MAG TPA: hypothetical protein VIM53_01350 [Candidatus Saccharimonadales bacterium]
MRNTRHLGVRLFLYTLMPTGIELCWCLVAGAVMVIAQFGKYTLLNVTVHTISQSVVGTTYHTDIVAPMQRFAGNTTVMTVMLEIVWSVLGVVVYELASFFVKRFTDWEDAEHGARFSPLGTVERYPWVRLLVERWLWRIMVGVAALSFTVFVLPYLYHHVLTGLDFYEVSTARLVAQTATIILTWSLIFHIYVVLLRLYVTRVRLFGKIVY